MQVSSLDKISWSAASNSPNHKQSLYKPIASLTPPNLPYHFESSQLWWEFCCPHFLFTYWCGLLLIALLSVGARGILHLHFSLAEATSIWILFSSSFFTSPKYFPSISFFSLWVCQETNLYVFTTVKMNYLWQTFFVEEMVTKCAKLKKSVQSWAI